MARPMVRGDRGRAAIAARGCWQVATGACGRACCAAAGADVRGLCGAVPQGARSSEWWLVSVPLTRGNAQSTWAMLRDKTEGEVELATSYRFNVPELRVGTLDSLLALSDDLVKVRSWHHVGVGWVGGDESFARVCSHVQAWGSAAPPWPSNARASCARQFLAHRCAASPSFPARRAFGRRWRSGAVQAR